MSSGKTLARTWPHSGTPGVHARGEAGCKGQGHTQDEGGGTHQQDRGPFGRSQPLQMKNGGILLTATENFYVNVSFLFQKNLLMMTTM